MGCSLARREKSLDGLVAALESPVATARNRAALQLMDFSQSAVEALFRSIGLPANKNSRGTLVYALGAFHCEDWFTELFDLAMNGNFEVQNGALSILRHQILKVSAAQFAQAEKLVKA